MGTYREVAAEHAGIGTTTLYRWLEQAEADEEQGQDSAFREFRDAVRQAEAEAEVRAVRAISDRIDEHDPRAAADFLSRRYPARWARSDRHQIEHSGTIRRDRAVDLSKLSEDEVDELERLVAQAAASS